MRFKEIVLIALTDIVILKILLKKMYSVDIAFLEFLAFYLVIALPLLILFAIFHMISVIHVPFYTLHIVDLFIIIGIFTISSNSKQKFSIKLRNVMKLVAMLVMLIVINYIILRIF